jgi:starch phosphorylase
MTDERRVAYFSMELAVDPRVPSYSGGLGVLAGDVIRSFADLMIPAVGITLMCNKGYFFQELDPQGNQIEVPVEWRPEDLMQRMEPKIKVPLGRREISVQSWRYDVNGRSGFTVPVFFLDTDLPENDEESRAISFQLYGRDQRYRLMQEIVLGIGGVRVLDSLGYTNIDVYHMNEGHTALLTIELLKKYGLPIDNAKLEAMKEKCVFTTHTPVPAGHDVFPKDMVREFLSPYLDDGTIELICTNGDNTKLNMTLLALRFSHYVNGVARKHGEISRSMFPGYPIDSITNGVHHVFWASKPFQRLFDKRVMGWRDDPSLLRASINIADEEVQDAHAEAKRKLIDYVNKMKNVGMDYNIFTIGYARRFTPYKRPTLLLQDLGRLDALGARGLQVIYAGKSHPNDTGGKEAIKEVIKASGELKNVKMTFLENYDIDLARTIASGCDLWLNTPKAPYEASGTSGMKAALNGVPSLSSLDGWWLEGHIEGMTGWSIGKRAEEGMEMSDDEDAKSLYSKLETEITPRYYDDKHSWAKTMKYAIGINASFFNSQRMVNQYLVKAYRSGKNDGS